MADPIEAHEKWWRMERQQHMIEKEQRRMERQQKEREQKMSEKSGGSDSLRESEAASLAMGLSLRQQNRHWRHKATSAA
jgi:hypothetical protein